jgi:large subunit ribosomal protein L21
MTVQAIIQDRGRQYPVNEGESLLVDYIAEAKVGGEHVFDQVLVLGETVGAPYVAGAKVKAKVEEHVKGAKLYVEKFRRRKDYRRRVGHRQPYTRLTISSISGKSER